MSAAPGNTSNTVGYFNQAASAWSDKYLGKGHFRTRLETVLGWLGERLAPPAEILDFGCGSGVFIKALAERGFTVTGVDASPGMIEASRVFLGEGGHHLEVVDPATFEGDYKECTYHGACCLGVLEYVENDAKLLATLTAVVKPGGVLVLSVPNQHSYLRKIERFVHKNPGFFKILGLFPHLTGPDSYLNFQKHQYSLHQLDSLLAPLGFNRQRSRYHVTPGLLRGLENHPALGMTAIALYEKTV